jgi:uncharacterized membrane protein
MLALGAAGAPTGAGAMSDALSRGPAASASSDDRVLSGLVYVLIFASPFFAGFTALIGIVLAYVRSTAGEPIARSHYRFQIRIFWIGLGLLVLSIAALLLGAGVVFTHIFEVAMRHGGGWDAWDASFSDGSNAHLNLAGLILVLLGALILGADMLWLMLASVFGFARLVSGEAVGRVRGLPG